MFALLTFETTGVVLTESGSGLTCNCICLRLREKVRAMSHKALWDSEVGETADSGVYPLEKRLQFTVSSGCICLPQQLLVSRYQSGLNEA